MWVSVDLCVVPIGVGVSLSPYIAACERVIAATGLTHQLGPNGTAIEGPWDEVMDCVRACHAELHGMASTHTAHNLVPRTLDRRAIGPQLMGQARGGDHPLTGSDVGRKANAHTDRHHAEVNTDPHQPATALDRLKQLTG